MLLPHIHREGSALAPAGHGGEAGKQTNLSPSPAAAASSRAAAGWGKIKEQVKKALMLKALGYPTPWPGSAGESRSSQCSLCGVLEELKLAWKLHLRAKVIPVAAPAWAEGSQAAQPQHPFILDPFNP